MVRIDRPMKAKNRRTEMMVETPSPPLEATICSEFSTGFASTGKASPETAEVFQNWALFGGISRRGVFSWMALFEVSESDESLWAFSEKKRGFGLRKGEERGKGERDIEREVAAMVHLPPLLSFGKGSDCCMEGDLDSRDRV